MLELLIIGLFICFIYLLSRSKPKQDSLNGLVDTNSREYIKGYLDGFNDHKNNIENTQITGGLSKSDFVASKIIKTGNSNQQKPSSKNHNINVSLYMASFLFVVAAALFLQQSFSNDVKFLGVWFVTALFYGGGLYISRKFPKIRTAGHAFVGTGLALLPFTGFALDFYILQNPSMSWMITSFIGLIGYVYAAAYLRSQTVTYFAIAFLVSLSTSSVASMNLALIWYFVVLILVGSVLTFIAYIKPRALPEYFTKPIEKTNTIIIPLTLIGSLLAGAELQLYEYSVITATCAIYYLAVAVTALHDATKNYSYLFSRLLITLSALTYGYFLTDSYTVVGMLMTTIALIQLSISVLFIPIRKHGNINHESWLWIGFVLQFIAMTMIQSHVNWVLILIMQLIIISVSSFAVAYYLKRSEISLFGTFSMAMLPIVWGRELMVPVVEDGWLSLIYAVYLMVVLTVRNSIKKTSDHPVLAQITLANFVIYIGSMLALSIGTGNLWIFGIWLIGAMFTYLYVVLQRNAVMIFAGNFMSVVSLLALLFETKDDAGWVYAISSIVFFSIFYLASVLTNHYNKIRYSWYFWLSSVISGIVFGVIGLLSIESGTQSIACLGIIMASASMMAKGVSRNAYTLTSWGLIVLTFALQRLVAVNVSDLDILVYTHWWAFVFALLSYAYLMLDKPKTSKIFTIIGLAFISFFGGISAISSMITADNSYSSLFIVEHAVLLIFGLITASNLQRNWGIVALILASLWMMSGFTFLLPVIIAVILLIFAVKSLSEQHHDK